MVARDEHGIQRRVTGAHDLRLDGIGDLLSRARGARVLDVGCNRGMAGYEFAVNGAALVHGCDHYAKGIETAREIFADIRNVASRFEVVDLSAPGAFAEVFGPERYDIVLLLAVFHKLKRVMVAQALDALIADLGDRTDRYVGWRGYAEEIPELDAIFARCGLTRIHTSEISETICPAAIWRRNS